MFQFFPFWTYFVMLMPLPTLSAVLGHPSALYGYEEENFKIAGR